MLKAEKVLEKLLKAEKARGSTQLNAYRQLNKCIVLYYKSLLHVLRGEGGECNSYSMDSLLLSKIIVTDD